ncbi:transposase [Ktedonosporobacter rubrisoli]|uniref:Transposase n=1 Tax=Ktedonosporobacter rubrisoli TaxID=2509675 RepID=A0A4P6JTI8_KTERU|nr:transposase [Ktedonosporobacter rubrisoli]
MFNVLQKLGEQRAIKRDALLRMLALRDKEAVVAGLTLPFNNGLVEGKVNKLKLLKRMGYGRASFALVRQRVLHAL